MQSQDGIGTNVLIYFKIAQSEFKWSEKNHNKPQDNIFSIGYFQAIFTRRSKSAGMLQQLIHK